jgi:hypothetical protein
VEVPVRLLLGTLDKGEESKGFVKAKKVADKVRPRDVPLPHGSSPAPYPTEARGQEEWLMEEELEAMFRVCGDCLTKEEQEVLKAMVRKHKGTFSRTLHQIGRLEEDVVEIFWIVTVEHKAWQHREPRVLRDQLETLVSVFEEEAGCRLV